MRSYCFHSAAFLTLLALSVWPVVPVGADDVTVPHTVRRLEIDPKLPAANPTQPALSVATVPDGVRVIDMKRLFEGNERFKQQMKDLKAAFDASAALVQTERNAIIKLEGELKDLPPGLPESKELDETIARRKADWKISGDKQLKEFRDRESKILWETYTEIQDAVGVYCKANGITLVMQFNGAPPDSRIPSGVVSAISRPMVYVDPSRDITPAIEKALNKR